MVFSKDHISIYEDTKDISGWLLPDETDQLYQLAHLHGDVILEVGTFRGRSAAVINAGAFSNPNRSSHQFYSVDIDPAAGFHAYDVLMSRGQERRAIFFNGDLKAFRDKFHTTPTMAFIDGDHTYEGVKSDLYELITLLSPNTPVAFHDYLNPDTPGVARAVNEWVASGFAVKTGTAGCSAFVLTTHQCKGQAKQIDERQFENFRCEFLQRISEPVVAAPSELTTRERIAMNFPWLVPIVRRIKHTFKAQE